ncbi:MAG: glycosyltransferase [Methanobacteriaceae archaeon]|nr:glycosyltransferase [Methanobacteriaceae archaeon]
MKILQVTPFFKPSWEAGGPPRLAYDISRSLLERGHEVTVYTTDGFKYRLDVEKNCPVNVDGIETYYFRNISNYLTRKMNFLTPYYLPVVARKDLKKFDLIHIHEHRTLMAVIVHYYARKYDIPYVLQPRGSAPLLGKDKQKIVFDKIYGDNIVHDADKIIFTSTREAKKTMETFPFIQEEQKIFIPNSIDMDYFKDLPRKGAFRSKYALSKDDKIILYLGRLNKIKGLDSLLKAFKLLKEDIENVKLVMVGPDDGYQDHLINMIRKLELEDDVLLTGTLDGKEKLCAYVDGDIFVLPSSYESFGNVVFESLLSGTPVIVSDKCGCADIINTAHCGLTFRFGDVKEMRDKINYLNSNPVHAKQMVANGRNYVKENLSHQQIITKIEEIYHNLIKE